MTTGCFLTQPRAVQKGGVTAVTFRALHGQIRAAQQGLPIVIVAVGRSDGYADTDRDAHVMSVCVDGFVQFPADGLRGVRRLNGRGESELVAVQADSHALALLDVAGRDAQHFIPEMLAERAGPDSLGVPDHAGGRKADRP